MNEGYEKKRKRTEKDPNVSSPALESCIPQLMSCVYIHQMPQEEVNFENC